MNIYWGVIRIWYVSTTCKGVEIWLQHYKKMEIESLKFWYSFVPVSDDPGMSFCFFMLVGFADILRHSPSFVKGHSHGQSSFLFWMRSAPRWFFHIEITSINSSKDDQSPVLIRIINEASCLLMRADEFTKSTPWYMNATLFYKSK